MLPYVLWAAALTLVFTSLLLLIKERLHLSAAHVVAGSLLSLVLSICFPVGLLLLSPIAAGAGILAVGLLATVILQPVIESSKSRLIWVEKLGLPRGLTKQLFFTRVLSGVKHIHEFLTRIGAKWSPAGRTAGSPAETETVVPEVNPAVLAELPASAAESPEALSEAAREAGAPSGNDATAVEMDEKMDGDEVDAEDFAVRTTDAGREFMVREDTPKLPRQQSRSLDELINGGFDAKEHGSWEEAISLFRQGLEVTRSLDLALLLVLEISCLYRDNGRYQQAIEVLSSFLNLYGGSLDDSRQMKLKNEIFYLETIYQLLHKSGTPNLPSSRIPRLIKLRAEELLRKRQSQAL